MGVKIQREVFWKGFTTADTIYVHLKYPKRDIPIFDSHIKKGGSTSTERRVRIRDFVMLMKNLPFEGKYPKTILGYLQEWKDLRDQILGPEGFEPSIGKQIIKLHPGNFPASKLCSGLPGRSNLLCPLGLFLPLVFSWTTFY